MSNHNPTVIVIIPPDPTRNTPLAQQRQAPRPLPSDTVQLLIPSRDGMTRVVSRTHDAGEVIADRAAFYGVRLLVALVALVGFFNLVNALFHTSAPLAARHGSAWVTVGCLVAIYYLTRTRAYRARRE